MNRRVVLWLLAFGCHAASEATPYRIETVAKSGLRLRDCPPMTARPHSPACERNRDPILDVLRVHFATRRRVLEIGSGTGQHAVHFAAALPHLVWQCTDRAPYLPGIHAWCDEAALANTPPPLLLDVLNDDWPARGFDAGFSANTLHIMGWPEVEAMFAGLDRSLGDDATLVIYGPFKRDGAHTSASNAAFDADLRRQDPKMGVRDREAVHALAAGIGFEPLAEIRMPANNLCLVWQRVRRKMAKHASPRRKPNRIASII